MKACTRQLSACCSNDLATQLSRTKGGKHFNLEEKELIDTIKKLAVRYQEFHGLNQQPD